jgi:hypothetical protein
MTSDPKLFFEVVSPAADVAVALARLTRAMTGDADYYIEAGKLGFGYRFAAAGLAVMVKWEGKRCLHVLQPANGGSRAVQPFDDDGPWVRELADTLRALRHRKAAGQAKPAG